MQLYHLAQNKMTVEEYITNRIDGQIKWFSKKANRHKVAHYSTSKIAMVLSTSITVVAIPEIQNKDLILGLLGAIVTILTGIGSFTKFQEMWLSYRNSAELLKREKILYESNSAPYKEVNDKYGLLVERVEAILGKERVSWINQKSK